MRLRVAHTSLQFSDTDKQHTADLEKIFDRLNNRHVAWITGTEAGAGAGNTSDELVRVAEDHGYLPWVPSAQAKGAGHATDGWLAVREDLVKKGTFKTGYEPAIPGSQELYKAQDLDEDLTPRWGPKGLVHAKFSTTVVGLGSVNLGVAHHLTGADNPKDAVIHGVDHWEWNEKLDDIIGDWMKEVAKGPALAFCNMDRNFADTRTDTQKVGNTTSLMDELEKWVNTGHGAIDWMLSYNKDGRVAGQSLNVLNDKAFFLNGDHFYVEGVYNVDPLKH